MHVGYKDENKGGGSKGVGIVGVVICTGRISKHMEIECNRGSREWKIDICNSGKFFTDLKQEFGKGDNKTIRVAEPKKVEQGSKMIKEFV